MCQPHCHFLPRSSLFPHLIIFFPFVFFVLLPMSPIPSYLLTNASNLKRGFAMAAASKQTRSRVKVVTQVPQLDAELQKASDRLVVLEFFSEK